MSLRMVHADELAARAARSEGAATERHGTKRDADESTANNSSAVLSESQVSASSHSAGLFLSNESAWNDDRNRQLQCEHCPAISPFSSRSSHIESTGRGSAPK